MSPSVEPVFPAVKATRTLKIAVCKPVELKKLTAKDKGYRRNEHLFFEVGVGAQYDRSDGYNDRLRDRHQPGGE